MARFPYSAHQIRQIVEMKKTIVGSRLNYVKYHEGEDSRHAKTELYADEVIANLTFIVWATDFQNTETYHAVFMIDNERIRGIDFEPAAIKRGYKKVVPAGWHQNIIDPNIGTWDGNRHEPIDLGVISGLDNFARKVCKEWNIEYGEPEKQLFLNEN